MQDHWIRRTLRHATRAPLTLFLTLGALSACDRPSAMPRAASVPAPDNSAPAFRNVVNRTAYVGDSNCISCHAKESAVYATHSMAQSFHAWKRSTQVERALATPILNVPTGYRYGVVDSGGQLYQVESRVDAAGRPTHQLTKRIDYVMGSGRLARTYFTEENGRLFQLPLTWYADHGWDFSPGYEINNARFDRVLPDRCIACHASYPTAAPALEGKYPVLRPGIGCERCHGPGALHVAERTAGAPRDSGYDRSIVNPARLPLERRLDTCEQCHVHTSVAVLREGKGAFDYIPSQRLHEQYAYFREAGNIDVVSHADRMKQSACFLQSRNTSAPMECATCHNPHRPPPTAVTRNQPCLSCHTEASLQARAKSAAAVAIHARGADCVTCHMPPIKESAVPHGKFTEHWIRANPSIPAPAIAQSGGQPIAPYFARDLTGPEAPLYQELGKIVYATLANDRRVLDAAATSLEQVLKNDATYSQAHFLLGVAHQQFGRTKEAVSALERSVRIDAQRPDPWRALAQAYERAGRKPGEIDAVYRRALALQPALGWIRAEYADFLQGQGRLGDAEAAYRAAVSEQPSLGAAWFNLGTTLVAADRVTAADSAFREAVARDPAYAEALQPLLTVHRKGATVTAVTARALTLGATPKAPGELTVSAGTDAMIAFTPVPAGGYVLLFKPDGTLVLALPTGAGGTLRWNMITGEKVPLPGGLYRVQVQGNRTSSSVTATTPRYLGVVQRTSQ